MCTREWENTHYRYRNEFGISLDSKKNIAGEYSRSNKRDLQSNSVIDYKNEYSILLLG